MHQKLTNSQLNLQQGTKKTKRPMKKLKAKKTEMLGKKVKS